MNRYNERPPPSHSLIVSVHCIYPPSCVCQHLPIHLCMPLPPLGLSLPLPLSLSLSILHQNSLSHSLSRSLLISPFPPCVADMGRLSSRPFSSPWGASAPSAWASGVKKPAASLTEEASLLSLLLSFLLLSRMEERNRATMLQALHSPHDIPAPPSLPPSPLSEAQSPSPPPPSTGWTQMDTRMGSLRSRSGW